MASYSVRLLAVVLFLNGCWSQEGGEGEEEEGTYRGKFIGNFNSYHHQVSGAVYAVDERTLLLSDFKYDGLGEDAYFWVGEGARAGSGGTLLPGEGGRTDVLRRYTGDTLRLRMPNNRKLANLRWLAVYDVASQAVFADVLLPDDFTPPAPLDLPPLRGDRVNSGPLHLLDAATLVLPELRIVPDGDAELHFAVGEGAAPHVGGTRLPDDYGYLEPLRTYTGQDVRLRLPAWVRKGGWFAVWDARGGRAVAHVPLPEVPDVPPAEEEPASEPAQLPLAHCRQLHARLQVAWEVFGGQITLELRGRIEDDEYMAFGTSGANDTAQMVGADVTVAWWDAKSRRGVATDYSLTERAACVEVLGGGRGACPDTRLGGSDDVQTLSGSSADGIVTVRWRRQLMAGEPLDKDVSGPAVWAIGRRGPDDLPLFHHTWPRVSPALNLTSPRVPDDCGPLSPRPPSHAPWERAELSAPDLRTFTFTLGPGGGSRAGSPGAPLVWYVNGHLRPALQLRRGLVYSARVRGGADPHRPDLYHPLVVTTSASGVTGTGGGALAGLRVTRRGRPEAAAAGGLCVARPPSGHDRRYDDDFGSFRAYNRSLRWECEGEGPAELRLAPNSSWPDRVYYHSYTQPDMGGVIDIVDRPRRGLSRRSHADPSSHTPHATLLIALSAIAGWWSLR